MEICISTIGMILLATGLTKMGYSPTTAVWWLICGGISLYTVGWKLIE